MPKTCATIISLSFFPSELRFGAQNTKVFLEEILRRFRMCECSKDEFRGSKTKLFETQTKFKLQQKKTKQNWNWVCCIFFKSEKRRRKKGF